MLLLTSCGKGMCTKSLFALMTALVVLLFAHLILIIRMILNGSTVLESVRNVLPHPETARILICGTAGTTPEV